MKNRFLMFFILLTLSIGLVSVNLPLSSYAQDNVLGQDGNGLADKGTEQLQSSKQDGQVVSGDSSVLSGNNLVCQDQENSKPFFAMDEFCISDKHHPATTAQLYLSLFADVTLEYITITFTGGPSLMEESFDSGANPTPIITIPIPTQMVMEGQSHDPIGKIRAQINPGDILCTITDNKQHFICDADIPSADADGKVHLALEVLK